MEAQTRRAAGIVYTFYSFKGGVGRSMALANVATLLARWGKKVLIIDWDLEAPGIEKYFAPYILPDRGRKEVPGLVELVAAHTTKPSWRDHVIAARFNDGTSLDIITAGRDDAEYVQRLRAINWAECFQQGFGDYLEEVRTEWIKEYDFVLIDSRTGITDIGGICTIHLPDAIVTLFTANQQSLEGVKDVMLRARRGHQQLPVERNQLLVIPVPARDESDREYKLAGEWRSRFAAELREFFEEWAPRGQRVEDVLNYLKIPYFSYWSFGEQLPVLHEDPLNPKTLAGAFGFLADLLLNQMDWNKASGGLSNEVAAAELQRLRESSVGRFEGSTPVSGRREEHRSSSTKYLVGLGIIVLVLVAAFELFRLSRLEHVDPRVSDAAVHAPTADEATRDRLRAAAANAKDPLEKALILREIPEAVFPAEDVKVLLRGARLPLLALHGQYTDARFDHDGSRLALVAKDTVDIVNVDGRGTPFTVHAHDSIDSASFVYEDSALLTVETNKALNHDEISIQGLSTPAAERRIDRFKSRETVAGIASDSDEYGGSTYGNAFVYTSTATGARVVDVVNTAGPHGKLSPRLDTVWESKRAIKAVGIVHGDVYAATSDGAIWPLLADSSVPLAPKVPLGATSPSSIEPDFSKDWIVVADRTNGAVRGWHFGAEGKPVAVAFDLGGPVVAITASGAHLAAAMNDAIVVPTLPGRDGYTRLVPTRGNPTAVALSSKFLLAGSSAGTLDLWPLADSSAGTRPEDPGPATNLLPPSDLPIQRVAFSSDGRLVLAASNESVRVWSTDSRSVDDVSAADLRQFLYDATRACLTVRERLDLLGESLDAATEAYESCTRGPQVNAPKK